MTGSMNTGFTSSEGHTCHEEKPGPDHQGLLFAKASWSVSLYEDPQITLPFAVVSIGLKKKKNPATIFCIAMQKQAWLKISQ